MKKLFRIFTPSCACLGMAVMAITLLTPVGAAMAQVTSPCSPAETAEFGEPVICKGTLTRGGKALFARLYWDILADTDEFHVVRIETARSANGPAKSVFADVDSRAPMTMQANGFEFIDVNFDGYTDFRLIEFLPAGPNIAYFNGIYDPATSRHIAATGLNALSAPEFDADAKTVMSTWRGNAATHGRDIYVWDGPALLLQQRVVSTFDDAENCMMTRYEPEGRVTAEMMGNGALEEVALTAVYEAPC
ncbi:hypothetical protein [Pyruvatibacter sp.]|uniref:XAC2610-related protein n=1 Tax=Pyruvatibacter sp. TaxID=1981328 RepID=UPI0032EBC006